MNNAQKKILAAYFFAGILINVIFAPSIFFNIGVACITAFLYFKSKK